MRFILVACREQLLVGIAFHRSVISIGQKSSMFFAEKKHTMVVLDCATLQLWVDCCAHQDELSRAGIYSLLWQAVTCGGPEGGWMGERVKKRSKDASFLKYLWRFQGERLPSGGSVGSPGCAVTLFWI